MNGPAYIQCLCPVHGPTTHLHWSPERDDWCLLEPFKASNTRESGLGTHSGHPAQPDPPNRKDRST